MIRRTIEVTSPGHLKVKLKQLVIQNDHDEHSIPFEDIGFLVLDNPQITCTQGVFRHCARENVAVVVTDEKHLPASLLLSLDVHSTQGKSMRMQAATPEEVRQAVWQQIIQAKIRAQSAVLTKACGTENTRLERLARTVLPGDIYNYEAQASRIYFRLLFGEGFRRDYNDPGNINILLNYGYSLVRSACARALMGAGLHPALGVHHHNQYNAFCLADDVMEPLRPLVDQCVLELSQAENCSGLDRDTKNSLLEILAAPVLVKQRRLPFMSALEMYCASLRKVLEAHKGRLTIPVMLP